MNREPDYIDVYLADDAPDVITLQAAWDGLRRVVLKSTGLDIDQPHPFNITVKRVSRTGNRVMNLLLAYPKGCKSPEELMAQSFCSVFGELGPGLADDAAAMARAGQTPQFAVSLAAARK